MDKLLLSTSASCDVCYDLDPRNVPRMVVLNLTKTATRDIVLPTVTLRKIRGARTCPICCLLSESIDAFYEEAGALDEDGTQVFMKGTADGKQPLRIWLSHKDLKTGEFWMQQPNTREVRSSLHLPEFGLEFYTEPGNS